MAWRVTEREVRLVVETDDDTLVAPFIDIANALVDDLESEDANSSLSAAMLKQIEILLSAHFYSHLDQPYIAKSTGGASGSFQGQFGMGLDSTRWGQSAKRLDKTGYLAQLDKGRSKVGGRWLGKASTNWEGYT